MPEERRLVTVLFADATGSTALGETLDPEDTRALLPGDDAELNAGLSVLERLGDLAQIHRLEPLRSGGR